MAEGDELAKRDSRAPHEDRDQLAEQPGQPAGHGGLTTEELDERLEAALTAKTYGELAVVLGDPPAVSASPAQPSTAKAKARPPYRMFWQWPTGLPEPERADARLAWLTTSR